MNNKMTIEDYCSNINGLRFITRFQGVSRTHDESVAEHSFFVAAFVYKLADIYKFDLNKTIKAALMHDCAEVEVSDVPYVVKKANPALATALEAAELDALSKKVDAETLEILKDFNSENEATTPEGLVIALADALEVVEYARTESTAGNDYMQQCFLNGNKRVEKLKTLLEPYKKMPELRTAEAVN